MCPELQCCPVVKMFIIRVALSYIEFIFQSLIPLANRPLLEYTLDCLVSSGVQEAILFCSSFADQVNSFIRYILTFFHFIAVILLTLLERLNH